MRFIIKDQPDWIGQWVADQIGFEYIPGRMQAIGLVQDNEVVAGVVVYDWTGTNCFLHVAVAPNYKQGGARDFLAAVFKYIFVQCGCLRCSGWIPASNSIAVKMIQKLGFTVEHSMEDAGPEGAHLLMGMRREDCRWIQE